MPGCGRGKVGKSGKQGRRWLMTTMMRMISRSLVWVKVTVRITPLFFPSRDSSSLPVRLFLDRGFFFVFAPPDSDFNTLLRGGSRYVFVLFAPPVFRAPIFSLFFFAVSQRRRRIFGIPDLFSLSLRPSLGSWLWFGVNHPLHHRAHV